MQLIADLLEFIAALSVKGVVISLAVGLAVSYIAWLLMPANGIRSVVSAISFVVGFVATLSLARRDRSRRAHPSRRSTLGDDASAPSGWLARDSRGSASTQSPQ